MAVPGIRYLLCRPNGGLNDALVQLELCRRHAVRFGRTMIVDLRRCGLQLPFDAVFAPRAGFGVPVVGLTPGLELELDACASVQPSALAGRISTYRSVWDSDIGGAVDALSRQRLCFDLDRDHPETLLVHEQAGGGTRGFGFLERVALVPEIAEPVAARLVPLGHDYDAIHVRNTDLSTDYDRLFRHCRPLFAGRPVLVCSDSVEVKLRARAAFDRSTILSVADIPDLSGKPLHESRLADPHASAIDLFCDLLAIARSRDFVFTTVDRRKGHRPGFSGFSVLADMLRRQPGTVRNLLGAASPALLAALYPSPPAPRAALGLRRALARLDQWRWNRHARYLSSRLGLKLRLAGLRPGASSSR